MCLTHLQLNSKPSHGVAEGEPICTLTNHGCQIHEQSSDHEQNGNPTLDSDCPANTKMLDRDFDADVACIKWPIRIAKNNSSCKCCDRHIGPDHDPMFHILSFGLCCIPVLHRSLFLANSLTLGLMRGRYMHAFTRFHALHAWIPELSGTETLLSYPIHSFSQHQYQ